MSLQIPKSDGRPVAVLGGGVLGRRLASSWASGGFDVHVRDPDEKQRADALKYWEDNKATYPRYLGTNRQPGSFKVFADLKEAIAQAWLVIECVPENLQLKMDTFTDLEELAPQDAILASNSSSYKSRDIVAKLSQKTQRRALNMHYHMPPAHNLVELMTSGSTAPEIFDFISEQLRSCGMGPVRVSKESTGFLFNRMWAALKREVLTMLSEEVSDPETIDHVWKQFWGTADGPCNLMDNVGLDTVKSIEETYVKERGLPTKDTVDFLEKNYLSQGKLGKKSDKGGLFPPLGLSGESQKDAVTLYFLDIGMLALQDPLHGGRVIAARADGTESRTIVEGESMPDGVDIDDGRLYWSNMGIPSENDGTVKSCKLDGSDVRVVIPSGKIHTPKQVMLDKKEKKLYVSDREGLRVFRCNYDGGDLEVIWKTGDFNKHEDVVDKTKHCVGIAIDDQFFYWTQKGAPKSSQGRILRAPKHAEVPEDPSKRTDTEVLFLNLPEPIDLEVDPEGGYLYWTDRGELPTGNTINRVALSDIATGPASEHKHQILVRNMHEAIGLKLDTKHGHMYSTDVGGTVYRFNLDGSDRRKMYDEQGAYTGIAISYGGQ